MAQTTEVTVDLTVKGLGIKIAGGADDGNLGIYIVEVDPAGAAAQAGLKAQDRIDAVDGRAMGSLTHQEALELLSSLSREVNFMITRAHNMVIQIGTETGDRSSTTEPTVERSATVRKAFQLGDVELSRLAHDMPTENHSPDYSAYLKAAIFGGMDGIITTFAVVASVAGANLAAEIVIVMGFANLLGDGVSMAFGEYMSLKAEHNHIEVERRREKWELENYPMGELKEMIEIYEQKGFSKEEAEQILTTMQKHKDFFLDHMMVQELGLLPPDDSESPVKSGVVMFLSFMLFGFIPLLSYVALSPIDWGEGFDATFLIACVLTGLSLFVLGVVRSKFSTTSWWRSGFWVFFNGAIAAGVAYLVGYIVSLIVDVETC